ncbi:hypothetical protein Megvenef_01556 [Candidatus Megaera venefica]|uniref:Uncharacterized protein n=1 Tax=Candidatus Megaera venefica TaxID=2055910 RepID=A0ABU5NEI6_9RICK|nr:hypothetical protein [Candidatus Megaera venefica]
MCGDLFLKFLKLYQKFRVLTERLIIIPPSLIASSYLSVSPTDKPTLSKAPITPSVIPPAPATAKAAAIGPAIAKPIHTGQLNLFLSWP